MAGTAVLKEPSFRETPVWERTITFTFASSDDGVVKYALPMNGILQKILIKVTGAGATATVTIDDNGDNEIWKVATLAEDTAAYTYSVSEPLTGVIDIGVLPSTDPLAAWVVIVTLRGI